MDLDPNGHTEVSGWDLSVLDCGLLEGRDSPGHVCLPCLACSCRYRAGVCVCGTEWSTAMGSISRISHQSRIPRDTNCQSPPLPRPRPIPQAGRLEEEHAEVGMNSFPKNAPRGRKRKFLGAHFKFGHLTHPLPHRMDVRGCYCCFGESKAEG